ncbi:uncharacterized protein LTR77_000956 [Saxophila tyrrhenica]|uniref:Uncharacterized protein n=1 Tax=Saxophila tyrrhenica TaxID=1690608 RepID=A0AAV9PPS6_9PEZI|nr:hypothetical protein LTR77_000956 [Saxophila tyrrhenica]
MARPKRLGLHDPADIVDFYPCEEFKHEGRVPADTPDEVSYKLDGLHSTDDIIRRLPNKLDPKGKFVFEIHQPGSCGTAVDLDTLMHRDYPHMDRNRAIALYHRVLKPTQNTQPATSSKDEKGGSVAKAAKKASGGPSSQGLKRPRKQSSSPIGDDDDSSSVADQEQTKPTAPSSADEGPRFIRFGMSNWYRNEEDPEEYQDCPVRALVVGKVHGGKVEYLEVPTWRFNDLWIGSVHHSAPFSLKSPFVFDPLFADADTTTKNLRQRSLTSPVRRKQTKEVAHLHIMIQVKALFSSCRFHYQPNRNAENPGSFRLPLNVQGALKWFEDCNHFKKWLPDCPAVEPNEDIGHLLDRKLGDDWTFNIWFLPQTPESRTLYRWDNTPQKIVGSWLDANWVAWMGRKLYFDAVIVRKSQDDGKFVQAPAILEEDEVESSSEEGGNGKSKGKGKERKRRSPPMKKKKGMAVNTTRSKYTTRQVQEEAPKEEAPKESKGGKTFGGCKQKAGVRKPAASTQPSQATASSSPERQAPGKTLCSIRRDSDNEIVRQTYDAEREEAVAARKAEEETSGKAIKSTPAKRRKSKDEE